MVTKTSIKWPDQCIPLKFCLDLNLHPAGRMNSKGNLFFKEFPKEFKLSETKDFNINSWEDNEMIPIGEDPKPSGIIILKDKKITFSGAVLEMAEFLASPNDMKGITPKTDKVVFEVIEEDDGNNEKQQTIYLYVF